MTKFSSILFVLLLVLTSFSAHAQEYPRGDVNQDGAVNISDVTCLIDNLLSGVPEGDVNQDGVANISDVTCLIDYLLTGTWGDEPVTPPDDHEWVDLGLPSGTLWATMNIGASCPEDYGTYFAWGETEPKESYSWDTYKWYKKGHYDANNNWHHGGMTKYCCYSSQGYDGFTDGKTELDPADDAATANWGAGARTPSKLQVEELITYCTWRWTERNGVDGRKVDGTLFTGPNGNTIFLPAPQIGYMINMWTRTLYTSQSSSNCAHTWQCYGTTPPGVVCSGANHRNNGQVIRAVREP